MTVRRTLAGAAGAALLALTLTSHPVLAQEAHGAHDMDGAHAHTAMMLNDLGTLESKFLDLADAMSQEQYMWRPMEGVRSVSEVFMLIVAENYLVPRAWSATPPEGVDLSDNPFRRLSQVTDKAEVIDHLRKSFAYFKGIVENLDETQMGEAIQFFGQERTVGEALFLINADMHEHLGQAIAYARTNEVVPPWTARAQANRQ